MVWILLTLIISAVDLYIGFKVNPKLKRGFRIFNPNDSDDVLFVVSLSLIPFSNICMLLRILILSIANIYLDNYDY